MYSIDLKFLNLAIRSVVIFQKTESTPSQTESQFLSLAVYLPNAATVGYSVLPPFQP